MSSTRLLRLTTGAVYYEPMTNVILRFFDDPGSRSW
jgi:hypothetical protein